jgi:hypothetical protein
VNGFEQIAVFYFFSRALHECEAFNFVGKKDPDFERRLPWSHENITRLFSLGQVFSFSMPRLSHYILPYATKAAKAAGIIAQRTPGNPAYLENNTHPNNAKTPR